MADLHRLIEAGILPMTLHLPTKATPLMPKEPLPMAGITVDTDLPLPNSTRV